MRVASTARRWRGGQTQSRNRACGLGGQGRAARAQRTVAGAGGGQGEKVEGRADGRVLQTSHPADTAKEAVRVRVASTARRWRGGRTQSRNRAYGLSGQGRAARAQRTVAGAEGRHGEKVEGRADRRVLQT